jgi:hypothetical protein
MYRTRGQVISEKVTRMNLLRSLISVGLVVLLLTMAGCTSATGPSAISQQSAINSTIVEKVEVIHFHRTQQCPSCIAIGNLTEQTVNDNFKKELASGRLVFKHIGYELPENAALTAQYGVTGSSLWIGVYDSSGFHKKEDVRVWSLINDKDAYTAYLSGVITKRLNGGLS